MAASLIYVDSEQYYIPSAPAIDLAGRGQIIYGKVSVEDVDFHAVTLIANADGAAVDLVYLRKAVARFYATDDVFGAAFLRNVIISIQKEELHVLNDAARLQFSEWHTKSVRVVVLNTCFEGPYFESRKGLHEAWRLYEDHASAFMCPVVPARGTSGT